MNKICQVFDLFYLFKFISFVKSLKQGRLKYRYDKLFKNRKRKTRKKN